MIPLPLTMVIIFHNFDQFQSPRPVHNAEKNVTKNMGIFSALEVGIQLRMESYRARNAIA